MRRKSTARLLLVWLGCFAMIVACDREAIPPGPSAKKPSPTQNNAVIRPTTEPAAKVSANLQSELAAKPENTTEPSSDQDAESEYPPIEKHFVISSAWKRLGPNEIWVDLEKHQVIVGGHICLRAGALEMFACPQHTKEHESVVATHTTSQFVHTALLAVGAKPGTPVQFDPQYKPATGPKVKITVRWMQDGKLRELPAQQMVRDIATRNAMVHNWLFVGSGIWKNPDTGENVYLADSGELICVSNFGNATMDLPVESSSAATGLLFDAMTENIPDLGTLVLLVLEPEVSPPGEPASDDRENASKVEKKDSSEAKIDK